MATKQKYWVYIRLRLPVEATDEKEADILGQSALKSVPTAEIRKVGVYPYTTAKAD